MEPMSEKRLTDEQEAEQERLISAVAEARQKLRDAETMYFLANAGSPLAASSVFVYERAKTEAMLAEQDLNGFRNSLLRL